MAAHVSSNRRRVTLTTRMLAAAMALEAIVSVRAPNLASASPADIFSIGAPVIGSAAPKAADIPVGDTSVSRTGALQYSYPISVAPGRSHMEPHLALSYSSQAPIYGALAAGWTIDLPVVTLDTSNGRLGDGGTKGYTSSLAGGHRLIQVTEQAPAGFSQWRAQNDTGYVRYQLATTPSPSYWWAALAPDGTTYYFGDTDAHTSGCSSIVSDEYAPVTRVVDPFGNSVEYWYGLGDAGDCRIQMVTWGENANIPMGAFAAVTFTYANPSPSCAGEPVGALTSFRTGKKIVTGGSELDTISAYAFPPLAYSTNGYTVPGTVDHTRVVSLTYNANTQSGTTRSGCYRQLASISERAWGPSAPEVDLPAITFTYGQSDFGAGALTWPQTATQTRPPFLAAVGAEADAPFANARYNLGWGYRFQSGQWPTVEAMMLDIDGDGLLDRVVSSPIKDFSGNVTRCQAVWERNHGRYGDFSGFPAFEAPRPIPLPTIKWASDPAQCNYNGGASANSYQWTNTPSLVEGCHLNYQATNFTNSTAGFWSSCPSNGGGGCPFQGYCSNGRDCTDNHGIIGDVRMYLAYRWIDINGDGRVDLVASPSKQGGNPLYDLQWGTGISGCAAPPPEPQLFGTFPPCLGPSGAIDALNGNYQMCNGQWPWMIYLNHGAGVFGRPGSLPDFIKYQPIPLESQGADASITWFPMSPAQAVNDIDGDGIPDGGYFQYTPDHNVNAWSIWRNDRTGGLMSQPGAHPYAFGGPYNGSPGDTQFTDSELALPNQPLEVQGTADLNGDGLPDHWSALAPDNAQALVAFNDGAAFGQTADEFAVVTRPGTDGQPVVIQGNSSWVSQGYRWDTKRLTDIDGDRRPDLLPPNAEWTGVFFNEGGQFASTIATIGAIVGPENYITVSNVLNQYYWELRSDMVDLDGDGIAEGVSFSAESGFNPGTMLLSKIATPSQPPRLLVNINNGRGAITSASYVTTANNDAVVQHPLDAIPKSMPQTEWVVSSLTVTDSVSSTSSTTSYKYTDPHFGPNDQAQFGFRGFEQIATTLPSGAVRADTYSFSPDWSGRLTKTVTHPAASDGYGDTSSIDQTTYTAFTLFSGTVTTYHATLDEHWVCNTSQDEPSCTASPAAYTSTAHAISACAAGVNETCSTTSNGTSVLWTEAGSHLQAQPAPLNYGDRQSSTTFDVESGASVYRVRPVLETKQVYANNAWTTYEQTRTRWTNDDRTPEYDDVWFNATGGSLTDCTPTQSNCATTHRTFDLATGNLVARQKPNQYSGGGPSATYSYDSRLLFVAIETLEPPHPGAASQQLQYLYDYGTGVRLQTTGPNANEVHAIQIDGIGRMKERDEMFDTGGGHQLFATEIDSYTDANPSTFDHQSAIDGGLGGGTVRYAEDVTELDGHGRPVRKTIFARGDAGADAVTTLAYSSAGTVSTVTVPDASHNDASAVTFTYTFDSLGRPLTAQRPDGSGITMTYSGLRTIATDSSGASTQTYKDAFGRLDAVWELKSQGAYAITSYSYDAADNIYYIIDPEGVATELDHDFAGGRTLVTRQIPNNQRTWIYGYDKNGNLESLITPGYPQDQHDIADYTTTIVFDDLDRPISKAIAPRTLSANDIALFGTGVETLVYDAGANGLGRLSSWGSYAPGAGAPTLATAPSWTLQGQLTYLEQTASGLAGMPNLARQFGRTYQVGGSAAGTYYYDSLGSTKTLTLVGLDAKGLPASVSIDAAVTDYLTVNAYAWSQQYTPPPPPDPITTIANTRNVNGLVTRQLATGPSGAGYPNAESDWMYDAIGRVNSQSVLGGSLQAQLARQDLAYFSADDVHTLDQYLPGGNHKQFSYSYDLRHQLVGATETTTGGTYFNATYGYGSAGRFSAAVENSSHPAGCEVQNRDVSYQYSGADPEEVTALVDNGSQQPIASFAYDATGNQTMKCLGTISNAVCSGEAYLYLYDGKDQLRRATHVGAQGATLASEEYWYDDNGRRTITVKRDGAGNKTEAIWWIGDLEAHYDGGGSATRIYSYVSLGTSVARVDRDASTTTIEYQYHGVANGTLATVDQVTGAVNASFSYAPFGEVIEAIDSGGLEGLSSHKRRWNDRFTDDVSGLAYYGARYYDKLSMTWTQADPLYRFVPELARASTPRRADLYTFSLNNSLRYFDPDGQDPASSTDGGASGCGLGTCGDNKTPDGDVLPDPIVGPRGGDSPQVTYWRSFCGQSPGSPGCMPAHVRTGAAASKKDSSDQSSPSFTERVGSLARSVGKALHTAHKLLVGACVLGSDGACEIVESIETGAEELAGKVGDFLGVGASGKGGGRDHEQWLISTLAKKYGLNREQQDLLHREVTGQGLTDDEIEGAARDLRDNQPKASSGEKDDNQGGDQE